MHVFFHTLGSLLGVVAYFFGIRRKVTLENLRRAFPDIEEEKRLTIAKGAYKNLGSVFLEMIYLRYAPQKKIINKLVVATPDVMPRATSLNKGVIIVSAHYSNWEWMAMGASPHLGGNFHIIVKNVAGKFTEKFLQNMRIRTGNKLIPAGDVRTMFKVLKENKFVALLGDQSAPSESVKVPFFNIETPTFEGPARLALRTGAPMLFAVCKPTKEHTFSLELIEIPYTDLTEASDDAVRELTKRHVQILEQNIREHPELWVWHHRRWKNA